MDVFCGIDFVNVDILIDFRSLTNSEKASAKRTTLFQRNFYLETENLTIIDKRIQNAICKSHFRKDIVEAPCPGEFEFFCGYSMIFCTDNLLYLQNVH